MWHGQKHTTKWFKDFGFKSYEWLFENESKADDTDSLVERLILNTQDIMNVMNMSDDKIYNLSLIHICRCRRGCHSRTRWSP